MSYRKALFAAALAALLTACAKTNVAVEQASAKPDAIHLSESTNTADTADMPEVVVSAKRDSKSIG